MQPLAKENLTREKLLEAGAQAIAAKSFNSCGLTEILALAGVPKGSFYHYFASKEDFGVALIERACAQYAELLEPLLADPTRSPLARLRAVFEQSRDECVSSGAGRQCLVPKLALETSQLSDPVHDAVKRAYATWSSLLAKVIREAQSVGEIGPSHDPDRLANLLWDPLESTCRHASLSIL